MAPPRPTTELVHTIAVHKGPVNVAIYNSGSNYLLTGGQDRSIKLCNPKTGAVIKSYNEHGYEVLGVDCTADNTKFASCGGDRNVLYWDVATGNVIKRYSGHNGKVNAVAFNKDATVLASGSYDTSVRLWDLKSQHWQPIQVLEGAKDSIMSIAIRDHLIMTGSVDGYVRTYDLRQGELTTDCFDQPVTSVTFLSDSMTYLVSTLDSTLRLMDLSEGTLLQSFSGPGYKNTSYRCKASLSNGEAMVVGGDETGKVVFWDLESGKELAAPKAHDKAVMWTAHHPTQGQMITASADGTVKVWRTPR